MFHGSLTRTQRSDHHANVMIGVSSLMFFIATWHLAINGFRMVAGYVDHGSTQDGPEAYISNLKSWDHILKDTLYATQENLGSAAAIYRCWILWGQNWKVILFPVALLLVNTAAGYMVCALYTAGPSTETVFDAQLTTWIRIFYSLAVVLNIITTFLMGYKIWITHRDSSPYNTACGSSQLIYILKVLVESAALQLIVEIILLGLYCSDLNAQYILLESVASVVGITFNAMTIRIKLHSLNSISSNFNNNPSSQNAVQTIGSAPTRHIQIEIFRDVELEEIEEHSSHDLQVFDPRPGSNGK
ncbi:hypothetical protein D9757_013398 [Collybiopsis confluens]|uniref:Uncharacterized protein n=1 Tax=Collybiopsis confluens TaxID=2823264 RepID=A0A8H5FRJ3_9AGAR|nr:hypothetical protein D9757_013398 [Collybiopsis confluens]